MYSHEVHQLQLFSPQASIVRVKNCFVHNKELLVDKSIHNPIMLPTMYQSWTVEQKPHLSFRQTETLSDTQAAPSRELMIFDTWGTSSYYHLLIDHIIPLWITREWMQQEFSILGGEPEYFRISKNDYELELPNIQKIFQYFLGRPFSENVSGMFRNVIYGYFYTYRPYHGPAHEPKIFPNYQYWLERFRSEFCAFPAQTADDYVLVPKRVTRNFSFVDQFVQKHAEKINFKVVDLGQLTIEEQIRLAGGAKAIFGAEGAAFANMVFMKKDCTVIPVSNDSSRFMFHSMLASYIGQRFIPVNVDKTGSSLIHDSIILDWLRK